MATSAYLYTGGDGYDILKDPALVKLINDLATAPKEIALFEKAVSSAPNRTITPKVEGRIVRIN